MIDCISELLSKYKINTIINGNSIDLPAHNITINYVDIKQNCEHSGNKNRNHLNGFSNRTIHVFSDEWILKREIVESIILSKLGIYKNRIYARKCIVLRIDNETKNDFLVNNHIQGKDSSIIKYGLYDGFKLLSVMTFGRRKITGGKDTGWEMVRFCTKQNTQVIGGAGKLFKYFLRNNDVNYITTYADKRWSDGNLYNQLGFVFKHESDSNYYYTKDYLHRIHRVSYQKHKLASKLKIFDPNLTEWQNMQANGYDRIWDCGNYVFEWHNT